MKQNVMLQNTSNVDVYNFAAGDTEGNIRFFVNLRSNGCKVLVDGESLPKRPGKVIQVPIKIMDNFVNELNLDQVDFIRMDVEGYEYHVIEGMKKTIQKFKPMIQLEVHKGHMGYENTKKFFEFFQKENYEIKYFHNRDLDLPFIGTLNDVKQYSITQILSMLDEKTLPNFFNIILVPASQNNHQLTREFS
jgi:FkbM family methyltransferase